MSAALARGSGAKRRRARSRRAPIEVHRHARAWLASRNDPGAQQDEANRGRQGFDKDQLRHNLTTALIAEGKDVPADLIDQALEGFS